MPNYLFVIGAPKCGTTSLAAALGARPDVALARGKEPCFFTDFASRDWAGLAEGAFRDTPRDLAEYEALFADKPDARWRLDASTDYLWNPVAPQRVADFAAHDDVGDVRVIAMLRDPVARVISEYQHTVRDGMETLGLEASLRAEDARAADGWHPLFYHRKRSLYSAQIARWAALFGDRLTVLDFHEAGDGAALLAGVEALLGLPAITEHPAALPHENKSHVPRSKALKALLYSPAVKAAARAILPRSLRKRAWARVDAMNRTQLQVTDAERAAIRDLLADEIAACIADPRIPTGHWDMTRG